MSVTHLIILLVFVPAYCMLFGYLWIGLKRNKIWATICYGVLAALHVALSIRSGPAAIVPAMLGVVLATAMGVLFLRAFGVGKSQKRASVDASQSAQAKVE